MIELKPQPLKEPEPVNAEKTAWHTMINSIYRSAFWLSPKPGMVPKLINGRWVWVEGDKGKTGD